MTERQYFTDKRNELFNQHPELKSVEAWGEYCYLPLDIPRFDHPELVEWFFQRCQDASKKRPDIASASYNTDPAFDAVDVLISDFNTQEEIWTLNVQQDFLELFPDIYKKILDHFPFKAVYRIRLWASKVNVYYHRDQSKFIDFPGAFRILLHDENPRSTLSLIDAPADTPNDFENMFIMPRPEETNCFAWNNLRTKHGSFFNPKYRKILMILDRYELDVERYHDLINRSVNKYQDKTMVSTRPRSDYVD